MTPAARLQAAAEVLELILEGDAAEKTLTTWGRKNRYAGSKDRAAVRDHVFRALRCQRSHAALGGVLTGRGLIIGALREDGVDVDSLFTGEGYAPAALSDEERNPQAFSSLAEQLDVPEWLWPIWQRSLDTSAEAAAQALQSRAPVHLRVNTLKITVAEAVSKLAEESVVAEPVEVSPTALIVLEGARRVKNTIAYTEGFVELQDGASQAVVDALPLQDATRVLDFCSGGGGKALAMAARMGAREVGWSEGSADVAVFAHDVDPKRMKDLPERAERAEAEITLIASADLDAATSFDLVLCDAPCSGSGSWRRDPEGKWRLNQSALDSVVALQAEILDQAAAYVAPGGYLAYSTCSMLDLENQLQSKAFLARHSGWTQSGEQAWQVHQGSDGFYVSIFHRA